MRTEEEVMVEIKALRSAVTRNDTDLIVRMISMVALEWAMGKNPVSPSERMTTVNEQIRLEDARGRGGRDGG